MSRRPISPVKPGADADAFIGGGRARAGEGGAEPLEAPVSQIQTTAPTAQQVPAPAPIPAPPAAPAKIRYRYPWQDPNLNERVKIAVNFRIDEIRKAKLEFAARRLGITMTDLIVRALDREITEALAEEGILES